MKLSMEKCSGDLEAEKGSWALLEEITSALAGGNSVRDVSRSGRAPTPNVTLVDQRGRELFHGTVRFMLLKCWSMHVS